MAAYLFLTDHTISRLLESVALQVLGIEYISKRKHIQCVDSLAIPNHINIDNILDIKIHFLRVFRKFLF
jgi:hypothetical protein